MHSNIIIKLLHTHVVIVHNYWTLKEQSHQKTCMKTNNRIHTQHLQKVILAFDTTVLFDAVVFSLTKEQNMMKVFHIIWGSSKMYQQKVKLSILISQSYKHHMIEV